MKKMTDNCLFRGPRHRNRSKRAMTLCINSRNELRLVDLDKVVYLEASGNYTDFHFSNGSTRSELSCLSSFESEISCLYSPPANPFVRLGRSLLVNTRYVAAVNVNRQTLAFTADKVAAVHLSREAAKQLKHDLWVRYEHAFHLPIHAGSDGKPAVSDSDV